MDRCFVVPPKVTHKIFLVAVSGKLSEVAKMEDGKGDYGPARGDDYFFDATTT